MQKIKEVKEKIEQKHEELKEAVKEKYEAIPSFGAVTNTIKMTLEQKHVEAKEAWVDGLKKNFGQSSARRFIEEKLCYPMEKHIYTTEDGYINTIYRIPGKVYTKPKLH